MNLLLTIPCAPTLFCRFFDVSVVPLAPPSTSSAALSCERSSSRTRYALGSSGTVAGTSARTMAGCVFVSSAVASSLPPPAPDPCCFFTGATIACEVSCAARFASHSSLLIDGAIGTALRIASARSSSDAWICRSLPFGLKFVEIMFGRQSLSRHATSTGSMPMSINSCAAPGFAISMSLSKCMRKSEAAA